MIAPDAINPAMYSARRDITPLDIKDEVAAYKAPIPLQGDTVVWFKNAQRSGKGLIGFVQKVSPNGTTVDIFVPGNMTQGLSYVRHMSDPNLKIEANRLDSGGWDFSEQWYAEKEWKAKVESAIAALDGKVRAFEDLLEKPSAAPITPQSVKAKAPKDQ